MDEQTLKEACGVIEFMPEPRIENIFGIVFRLKGAVEIKVGECYGGHMVNKIEDTGEYFKIVAESPNFVLINKRFVVSVECIGRTE